MSLEGVVAVTAGVVLLVLLALVAATRRGKPPEPDLFWDTGDEHGEDK